MNKYFVTWIIFGVTIPAAAQKPVDEVKKLHQQYCTAVERKDSVFLKTLFHDNMVITGGNGVKRNKREEIKDALHPDYSVTYFKSRKEDFRQFEQTVVITGELFWEMVYQGKTTNLERCFTFTYARIGMEWKIVAQHMGRVPPPQG